MTSVCACIGARHSADFSMGVQGAEDDARRVCVLNPTSSAMQGWFKAVGSASAYAAATYAQPIVQRAFLAALASEMDRRGITFLNA